ncbi:MAG: hypothetical protein LUI14_00635, partial [Lachnospiraceae bacterium]|nr:hypothetical protein [Lachnospiraceae bacterium]
KSGTVKQIYFWSFEFSNNTFRSRHTFPPNYTRRSPTNPLQNNYRKKSIPHSCICAFRRTSTLIPNMKFVPFPSFPRPEKVFPDVPEIPAIFPPVYVILWRKNYLQMFPYRPPQSAGFYLNAFQTILTLSMYIVLPLPV